MWGYGYPYWGCRDFDCDNDFDFFPRRGFYPRRRFRRFWW